MWNKIQYGLIFAWAKLHAFLPMSVLYVLSDILYVLIYWVIRYRINRITPVGKGLLPSFCRLYCRDNQTGAYLSRRSIAPCPYQESRSGNPFAGRRTKNSDDANGPLRQLGMVQRLQPGIYRFVPVANLPTVK